MNKRALLFINPQARRGRDCQAEIIQQLQTLGLDLLPLSSDLSQISDLIHQYREQVDLVIVGGGDGTLNAVVDSLVETRLPLGILPLGTANDLARTLGIPPTIPEACEVIATGCPQAIDLGWVNGRHFFNVASLGLSVKITQQLSKGAKRRWGILAYVLTAAQVLWQARPFPAEIQLDGESIAVKTVQISIGNGRYYGGGMAIASDATIDDQRLDLYSLEVGHWWQILLLLPAMHQGRQVGWEATRLLQGHEIQIHTHKRHTINTDGELTTQTPAQFRVVPQAMTVLVPS